MSDGLNRFLGDTPLRVLVKLLILSVVAGFLMSVFGLYPDDILYAVRNFVLDIWHSGFAALGRIGDYLLLGAVIVIPIFIVIRLLTFRRKGGSGCEEKTPAGKMRCRNGHGQRRKLRRRITMKIGMTMTAPSNR